MEGPAISGKMSKSSGVKELILTALLPQGKKSGQGRWGERNLISLGAARGPLSHQPLLKV